MNMKGKILLLCVCMLLPIGVMAQIMKDSTVQVVAYWNKGDAYKYKLYTEEFEVEGNDTIWGDSSEETFMIEVVDSTENEYVLKYQCLENKQNMVDKDMQALLEPFMKKYEGSPIYFSTTPYGGFKDIVRWDEYQAVIDSIIVDLRSSIGEYFKMQGMDDMSEEDRNMFGLMMEQMFESLKKKETFIMNMEYIHGPLFYHGGRWEQNREYQGKQMFASPFVPTEQVEGTVTFGINKVDYDLDWVTFIRRQQFDAGQLLDSFTRFLTAQFPEGKGVELTPDQIPFVMVETYYDQDVHVGSGWPGAAYYLKVLQTGEMQRVKRWWLDILFDE